MRRDPRRRNRAKAIEFRWLHERLEELDSESMLRKLIPREICGTELLVGTRRLINYGSNDYLGIAMERAARARKSTSSTTPSRELYGATASALMCGYSEAHERLCQRIARLEGTEAAVLFPTGFAACSGTISALADAGDLILSDALNHASLIDGCRLSKAEKYIYPHRDYKAVRALLESHRSRFRNVFIVTDSVFSMDGTCAPLQELADCSEELDAVLVVDEAHATGVLGKSGGGLCEALGVADRVPIRIGTLSKALAAQGGFVAGPRVVVDYLVQTSRPLIFSTAAPVQVIEACLESIDVIHEEPERRKRVLANANRLRELLRQASVKTVGEGTPIVPVIVGDADSTMRMSQALSEQGLFVPPVRPPTVPAGSSRLRISLTAAHTESQVEQLATSIIELSK